jgi:hypothetical protein
MMGGGGWTSGRLLGWFDGGCSRWWERRRRGALGAWSSERDGWEIGGRDKWLKVYLWRETRGVPTAVGGVDVVRVLGSVLFWPVVPRYPGRAWLRGQLVKTVGKTGVEGNASRLVQRVANTVRASPKSGLASCWCCCFMLARRRTGKGTMGGDEVTCAGRVGGHGWETGTRWNKGGTAGEGTSLRGQRAVGSGRLTLPLWLLFGRGGWVAQELRTGEHHQA